MDKFGHIRNDRRLAHLAKNSVPVQIPELIGDKYNIGFSYGLRKLVGAYSGPLIQVRRSSDNALQDIYSDGDGNLDITQLTSFVGSSDGFVRILYDQHSRTNFAQATNTNQPRIILSGVVDEISTGYPGIYFDGVNHFMSIVNTALVYSANVTQGFSAIVVSRCITNIDVRFVFQIPSTTNLTIFCVIHNQPTAGNTGFSCGGRRLTTDSYQAIGTESYSGTIKIITSSRNLLLRKINSFVNDKFNGILEPFQTSGDTVAANAPVIGGGSGVTIQRLNGYISELHISHEYYDQYVSSEVNNDINKYYGIY
jgi:hypothetical protein